MIKVLVSGAAGKMGREVCKAVLAEPEFMLVGAVDVAAAGSDLSEVIQASALDIIIHDNLSEGIKIFEPDVMVDFTHPSAVMENINTALRGGVNVVVGTTGISEKDLIKIEKWSAEYKKNAFVCPNFAIGAVLMMKMAEIASGVMEDVEIIELHHAGKADAPSGTALKTAEVMEKRIKSGPVAGKESLKGVRGATYKNIRIHSVRLPGLVAHQQVIFGGKGQTLTITHDSLDRSSFMPGVVIAVREVMKRPGLTYGLEKVLPI